MPRPRRLSTCSAVPLAPTAPDVLYARGMELSMPLEEAMRDPHFVERGLFAHQVATASGTSLPALPLPISPEFREPPGVKKAPKLG